MVVAITGTLLQAAARSSAAHPALPVGPTPPTVRILTQYLPLLLVNWGLTAYVSRLFRARNALPALLGPGWRGTGQFLIDVGLAIGAFCFIQAFEALSAHGLDTGRNAAVSGLLPSTEAERLTWLLVALSVGFCEEVVYRGYLQTQLTAFTGRASFGIVLQALLFGIAHAEQGLASALRIALYGLSLGALARFRASLLACILCHIAIDLAGALAR
ncbi:MAG: CPBP family intramembrane glutamic endopeptidase [Polyangiaceae bacterium]